MPINLKIAVNCNFKFTAKTWGSIKWLIYAESLLLVELHTHAETGGATSQKNTLQSRSELRYMEIEQGLNGATSIQHLTEMTGQFR